MKLVSIGQVIELEKFVRLPQNVLGLLKYKDLKLKPVDILAYSIMLNRLNLSLSNPDKFNRNGIVYIVYEQKELAAELGLSNRGVISVLERLENVGLIVVERQGQMLPNLYMFKDVFTETTESLYEKLSHTVCKTLTREVRNSHCIKNNIIKTDDIKTNNIYTTLSSGGHFFYIYSIVYQRYMNQSHPDVTQELLDKLRYNLDTTIERLNVVEEDLSELIEYHFQNLGKNNNGHIQALLSNATDSPLYRYYDDVYNS